MVITGQMLFGLSLACRRQLRHSSVISVSVMAVTQVRSSGRRIGPLEARAMTIAINKNNTFAVNLVCVHGRFNLATSFGTGVEQHSDRDLAAEKTD